MCWVYPNHIIKFLEEIKIILLLNLSKQCLPAQEAVKKTDPSSKDDKVMDSMLTMIHSLVTSAEMFFKHKSLSDKGPFSLVINGIKILKVGGVLSQVLVLTNKMLCYKLWLTWWNLLWS